MLVVVLLFVVVDVLLVSLDVLDELVPVLFVDDVPVLDRVDEVPLVLVPVLVVPVDPVPVVPDAVLFGVVDASFAVLIPVVPTVSSLLIPFNQSVA